MSQRLLRPLRGGIRLDQKKKRTQDSTSRRLPIPEKLFLPLQQHIGVGAYPCVELGQQVHKGELIAETQSMVGMRLHAPTSGVISAIDKFPVIHPSGLGATCIELTTDGKDTAVGSTGINEVEVPDGAEVCDRIAKAGIVGHGGVGFPTQVKVREGMEHQVDTLIINAVECEPFINCDDRLIRECPQEVLDGAALIARTIGAGECIVALGDDMPEAATALQQVASEAIELVSIPAIYPAGGEKQLITIVTGREVPGGFLPIHIGIVVLNVATVVAIHRAVTAGRPLIERLVTVAGEVPRPGNIEVLIGTPVRHLLEHLGVVGEADHRFVSGGPMMGTEILDTRSPITKTVNCILVLAPDRPKAPVAACIRCGNCIPVCPVGLQPQQLFATTHISDFDAAQDHHLFDCIDCGCCAYVCPSRLPLAHYFRYAKSSIEALERDRVQADRARARYDAHNRRLSAGEGMDDVRAGELIDVSAMDTAALRSGIEEAIARDRQRRQGETDDG